MYYVEDNNIRLSVFIDQISMIDYGSVGFMSVIGSHRALEDFRHRLVSSSFASLYIYENTDTDDHRLVTRIYSSASKSYRFFFKKLDNAPFWVMTVIHVDVYHSCQDLVRGIRLSENQRKTEASGQLWYRLPIYYLFRGSDLFNTDEEMHRFMQANDSDKLSILQSNQTFVDVLYRKLSSCSRLPFLREWMGPLLSLKLTSSSYNFVTIFTNGFLRQTENISREEKIFTFYTVFEEQKLKAAITRCFQQNLISAGSDVTRGDVSNINTLTDYLAKFSDNLVQKAHERFEPLYTPGISKPSKKAEAFFTNTKYFSDLDYYSAQKDMVCSVAKGLARNKRTLVVSECGTGKTAVALASIYVHTQKKNPVTMVMCPGHMVEKWKEEILRLYPFAQAHIIERLDQLRKFEPKIRQKAATSPLFLIFGKDSCKMDYDTYPALHWNSRKKYFEMPNKEKVNIKIPGGLSSLLLKKYEEYINFFLKPNTKNQHALRVLLNPENERLDRPSNKKEEKYEWHTVESKNGKNIQKIWSAASSKTGEWVKIPKVGWVNTLLAQQFVDAVDRTAAAGQEISKDILKAYDIATVALGEETAKPMIRCNVSDYICRRMKNCIDYFIADEVHLYSSKDTAQGKAFSNMVNTAKYTIALTGTLLNGYAENVFSMLFKLYSRAFVRNGFSYNDSRNFAKEYGVVDTIREYDISTNRWGQQIETQTKMTTKYKPGISPLLFSRFLLDKAVFVTLADITADLPSYHEIPLGIEMDYETKNGYTQFFNDFRTALREHPDDKDQFLLKTIRRLNMYPDQPYDQVPVFNNETGQQILCPPSIQLQKGKTFASNKDKKLLELIQKHKANGEKVLVYVHWVNKLDCTERIQALLKEKGISYAFLTKSVSARARKKWIEDKVKEGIDVLICNPNLVKEGLDLLDFTTIIFYEMDDKLFTLRQASRRSLRLNQSRDITVYILYFKDTTQENIICLMANKLRAAMTIEGKFSEEGLNALSDTDSILTQLANNLTKDIDMKLEAGAFDFHTIEAETSGNRFKGINRNIRKDWLYKVKSVSKKKPVVINIDDELEMLKTGS